jgi:tetratricopeptide (TPR) repeat protein
VDEHLALVDSRYQLGTVLARKSGRRREEEQAYRAAVDAQAALVAQNRDRPELRATLGRYLNNLGMLLTFERPDEAERLFREALELEEVLFRESPTLPGPRWQLGRISNNLGVLLLTTKGRQPEVEALFRRARDLFQALAAEFPKVPQYRRELALVHSNLGHAKQGPALHREAEQDYRRALDLLGSLAHEFPEIPEYRQKATAESIQLNILNAETTSPDAERVVQEALQEQERFVAAYPEVPEYANVLGRQYFEMGRLLIGQGDANGLERYLEPAIRHHRAALRADPENLSYRINLGEDLVFKARALIARDDHVRAADAAEELPRLLPADLRGYLEAASFLVKCAAAAARDTALAEPQRQARAAAYESRAIQVLAQAVARRLIQGVGPLDIPELSRLRTRTDFQQLRKAVRDVPVGSRGATPAVRSNETTL